VQINRKRQSTQQTRVYTICDDVVQTARLDNSLCPVRQVNHLGMQPAMQVNSAS